MSNSSITAFSRLEPLSDMAIDESNVTKVADSIIPEKEANEKVDFHEVLCTFPEIRGDVTAATKVVKPTYFVQNSDVLYVPTREGNTAIASNNSVDFQVQARFAREWDMCKFYQAGEEYQASGKEGVQDSSADKDGKVANSTTELPLRVLRTNSILPGCYIKCFSKSHSRQPIETSCLEHSKDYPVHTKVLSTVKVSGLSFYDHPLFIEEERLCSQLQLTFDTYRRHLEQCILSSLQPRLMTLIPQVISLLTSIYGTDEVKHESMQPVLSSLIAELVEVVSLTANEIYHSKELGSTLWSLWNNLKCCRTRQNFQSTSVELIAMVDSGKDHNSSTDCQTYIKELTNFLHQLLLDSKETEGINSAFAKDAPIKLKDQLQNVLIAAETIIRTFNKPELSFTLFQEKTITATIATTNAKEQARRRQVSSERYYVRLIVDNKCIGCSKPVSLSWPQFSLPIDHVFELSLTKKPWRIAIELVKCAPGAVLTLLNQVISYIFIGIPNEPCTEKEIRMPIMYQFASLKSYKSIDGYRTRLKGFIAVFESLDGKFSLHERTKSKAETLVCAPELKAQGRFRGLKVSQQQCMVSNSGILCSRCDKEMIRVKVPDQKSTYLVRSTDATINLF
jgi:hypothetical protein